MRTNVSGRLGRTSGGARRPGRWSRLAIATGATAASLVGLVGGAPPAHAADSDEEALAAMYAPVMMLVTQQEACGAGEPFVPSVVDPLFDNPDVALRGPWAEDNLVEVAPSVEDLTEDAAGLPDYALDLPGDNLEPGCTYEKWADRVWRDETPSIYARVAAEESHPGRLAVQYWFYYPFDDFNNKHESDWEHIQVEFAADTAAEALQQDPVRTAYSQHYGAELAEWGDPKLSVLDGTHPRVFVSAGSHASMYTSGLYLGRSATQGFGCDTTVTPLDTVEPAVVTIPQDATAAEAEFPWLAYQGHWGERGERRFYDGPKGPSTHQAWKVPMTWSDRARANSYAIPGGASYGGAATTFFCPAIETASNLFRYYTDSPSLALALLGLVALGVGLLVRAARNGPPALPARAVRGPLDLVGAAVAFSLSHKRVLLLLGLPLAGLQVLQSLLISPLLVSMSQHGPGPQDVVRAVWGGVVGLLGLLLVLLVTASSATLLAAREEGVRRPTARAVVGAALRRLAPLIGTGVVAYGLVVLAAVTVVLLPLAVLLLLAWSLLVPVVVVERRSGWGALRRSVRLARLQPLTVLVVFGLSMVLYTFLGGLLSTLVILLVPTPYAVVNLLPGIVTALVQPFVGIMLAYAWFTGVARDEVATAEREADREPATTS